MATLATTLAEKGRSTMHLATKFTPEQSCFRRAVKAGYECAEFWLDHRLLSRWVEIADVAGSFDMRYALHFPNRQELPDDTAAHAAALYRALDCRAMVIHAGQFERYGQQILSAAGEVRLGVENHRLSPTELEEWAGEYEYLTLDVEHLWKFTLDDAPLDDVFAFLDDFLDRHVGKIIHVHLPGYRPGKPEHSPMHHSPEFVSGVWSRLAERGYHGFTVAEVLRKWQKSDHLPADVKLFEQWRQSQTRTIAEPAPRS